MTHTCTKVTVRQRAIRNDKISLYLDYYPAIRHPETMIMSRREYLGIYIYAHPKNEMEREFNNDMLKSRSHPLYPCAVTNQRRVRFLRQTQNESRLPRLLCQDDEE